MEDKISVSVIVPVYNVEQYLSRCIDSIINQTFKDIEVILINDGSTDSSLEILNEYESKDKRVKIINNENIGVSTSRNIGISEAKGEYIVFVDSDDWIDENMIEYMYEYITRDKCDLAMCTYTREFSDHSKKKIFNLPKISIYEDKDIKEQLLRKLVGPVGNELSNPEYLDALGTVWAKMYKTTLLKENNIQFIDLSVIGSGEDTLFNIYALNKTKKAILINKPMYHYWRDNPKSITSKYIPSFREKRRNYFKYIENFIKDNDLENEYKVAFNNRICISVLGMGLIECSKSNNISFFNKIKNIKRILGEDYIINAYRNLELKNFSTHWKIFYFFNKYRLSIPSFLMLNSIEILRKIL